MSVIGIVCEYNPFHKGHAYQLSEARRFAPGSTVVCVQSGDFVQRGEAALFTKYARAEAACRCGVDLVIASGLLRSGRDFLRQRKRRCGGIGAAVKVPRRRTES